MAEILVRAVNNVHPDATIDRESSYKRGYCVVVREDNWPWGGAERRPNFVVIKIPNISVSKVRKYVASDCDIETADHGEETKVVYRRRLWKIRWDDLPQHAKDRLRDDGELIIKAHVDTVTYDYTWTQVKNFFRNQRTGLDETEEL